MNNISYSVLVLSCDKYSWLWQAFFERFNKFWPEKDVKINLLTNHKKCDLPNVNTIDIGEDVDWSTNLLRGIQKINERYIFITFEDVYLCNNVDTTFFDDLKKFIHENNVEYLNTKANPRPKTYGSSQKIVRLKQGMHYRASLANAFWRKDVLLSILREGETPWEFEHNGTARSNKYERFYGTTIPLLSFDHIVVGGRLTRKSSRLLDVQGAASGLGIPVMSNIENAFFNLSVLRNKYFSKFVPTSWQQKIRNAFR